jgi:hypothetical protein
MLGGTMSIGLMFLIIAGAIVLIVKRFLGEPVDARDTFLTPLILVGIGIYSVAHVDDLTATDITWLTIGALVGIAFGALRGTTTILFARDGHLWQRYTVKTLIVWATSAAAGFAVTLLGSAMGMHPDARPITLSLGVGMLGEMLTLGLRALSTGVPFAPDKRATSPTSAPAQDRSSLDRFLNTLGHPGTAAPGPDTTLRDRPSSYPHAPQPDPDSTDPYRKPTNPELNASPTLRDGIDWLSRSLGRR